MLEITAAGIVAIITLILIYLRWNFNYWEKKGVRGPKPEIIVGTFKKSSQGKCNFIEELHEIYLEYKATEKFVGVFVARSPKLFILDPELARQILTTNFSSFHDNESSKWSHLDVEKLRFQSPFVNIGDSWREKRSEIVPALTITRLRSFYPVMQAISKNMTKYLKFKKEIDAKEISSRFTAEVVSDFIWGIKAEAFDEEKNSMIQEVGKYMISQALKCVKLYAKYSAWPLIQKLFPQRFFPESSDVFFTQITEDALTQRLKQENDRQDVLSHLIQLKNKKKLSLTEITGHSTTVFIDGFETAAIAISHCLLLLGRNKEAQEKLRKEILENLDEIDGLSFDRLNELPYLDQCIQETLRIFPPLPTLFKICTSKTTLENSEGRKISLNPGDCVYISSFSFHRDGDIFENPEEFSPERFDPSVGGIRKFRELGAFLPFGDGPRMCLGMKLGLLETKVAVVEIVRNFNISLSKSTRLDNKLETSSFLLALEGRIGLNLDYIEKGES